MATGLELFADYFQIHVLTEYALAIGIAVNDTVTIVTMTSQISRRTATTTTSTTSSRQAFTRPPDGSS
ncbi:hypothetical protein [Streptomyces sp. NPDC088746]|uniref:hypothetical protein n=1 Tax=Streptomyces sp. NPDC088746 TaxID=3365885 RepID=UPI003825FF1B